MTPKTPGVPLCELKGWPSPQSEAYDEGGDLDYIQGRNSQLEDLGHECLTVDVEALAQDLYYSWYGKDWTHLTEITKLLYRVQAQALVDRGLRFVHLSDGEGNDEGN